MKRKRIVSMLLVATMAATLFAGCGNDSGKKGGTETGSAKEFDAFFAVPGTEINDDNEIQKIIEEKTGVRVKETWLTGQTADEAIGTMIAGGEYPDFIEGASGQMQLYDAGALVPLDDYIEKYPNIKNLFTDLEWEKLRQDDGHIYWIPQFSCIKGDEKVCTHNDEAFWIQARVLKWANYPEIKTLDQYFDLIEKYNEANPTMADGTENIPYTILCDDWRYFCLENAPQFLDGYPNDGSCMVDPDTKKVLDYNTSDTAVKYFKKLNEEYQKGIVDPESFTQTYDEYIAKLSSGRVCGMVDQHWNFQDAENAIKQQGLDDCTYVPLGIVIDKGIEERYHSEAALDATGGIGITVSCDDIEGAMKFLNDLLSPEILTLRNWGQEGIDYFVGDDGLFYRNEEQRKNSVDQAYINANMCSYSYFPGYIGMDHDGINAYNPSNQPAEFYESLLEPVKECFNAYGVQTYTQMLNPSKEKSPWFPMWSYSNAFTTETPWGLAKVNMDEVKHEYLPKVVISDDFESAWNEYLTVYNDRCDVEAYLNALTEEVQRRIAVAEGN